MNLLFSPLEGDFPPEMGGERGEGEEKGDRKSSYHNQALWKEKSVFRNFLGGLKRSERIHRNLYHFLSQKARHPRGGEVKHADRGGVRLFCEKRVSQPTILKSGNKKPASGRITQKGKRKKREGKRISPPSSDKKASRCGVSLSTATEMGHLQRGKRKGVQRKKILCIKQLPDSRKGGVNLGGDQGKGKGEGKRFLRLHDLTKKKKGTGVLPLSGAPSLRGFEVFLRGRKNHLIIMKKKKKDQLQKKKKNDRRALRSKEKTAALWPACAKVQNDGERGKRGG